MEALVCSYVCLSVCRSSSYCGISGRTSPKTPEVYAGTKICPLPATSFRRLAKVRSSNETSVSVVNGPCSDFNESGKHSRIKLHKELPGWLGNPTHTELSERWMRLNGRTSSVVTRNSIILVLYTHIDNINIDTDIAEDKCTDADIDMKLRYATAMTVDKDIDPNTGMYIYIYICIHTHTYIYRHRHT